MAINGTDQLIIDRSGTLYRAPVSDLPGGGMTVTVYTDQSAYDADTPGANELVVLDGDGLSDLTLATDVAAPAAPAANNVTIYGAKEAGRDTPAWRGAEGIIHRVQAWLARKSVAWAMPTGAGTAIQTMGTSLTATGTATTATMAATNIHTAIRRLNYLVTTAATTAVAGWRQSFANVFIGAASALFGGFHATYRFGRPTGAAANATLRGFTGLIAATGAPTDVNPSTLVNMIGVGCDAADANYQIMHNDGSGTATKIDTGFAKNDADATEMYELQLYARRGRGGQVDYVFTQLSDGASVSGSITTNLPANDTMLATQGWYSVGGTSSVIGYSLAGFWIDTDY